MADAMILIDHPLVQHKVALLRDKNTGTKQFKELVAEISLLMCYEAMRRLPTEPVQVETPLAVANARMLAGPKLAFVPILRAGLGMVDAMLRLVPAAKVGHIGLYRDPNTLQPVEYYCKLPGDIDRRDVFLLDPMLATGGSACDAVDLLKAKGARRIYFMGIIAAPQGLALLQARHPDVAVYVAALDETLDSHGYIVPGLGDAGDRIFGTK